MISRLVCTSLCLSLSLICFCLQATAAEQNLRHETLIIGKVSDNPKKHFRRLKPMADYVVSQMGDLGIKHARVLMAKDNKTMIKYLKDGKVDWVTETAFSAVIFERLGVAEILLRKWKKEVPDYHTVFITRKDSEIQSLHDLSGQRLALEDPGSSTAFFLPMYVLLHAGLKPVRLRKPDDVIAAGSVGYYFTRGEINIATWVHKGRVVAGAYNNLDWATADHTPLVYKNDLRIFHRSENIPRSLELVRSGLSSETKQRLKDTLLKAHLNPDGEKALAAYQQTTRFDAVDEKLRTELNQVDRMLGTIQQALSKK